MSVDKFGRHSNLKQHAAQRGPRGIGFNLTDDGDFDIGGKRLTNIETVPIYNHEACSKMYVEHRLSAVENATRTSIQASNKSDNDKLKSELQSVINKNKADLKALLYNTLNQTKSNIQNEINKSMEQNKNAIYSHIANEITLVTNTTNPVKHFSNDLEANKIRLNDLNNTVEINNKSIYAHVKNEIDGIRTQFEHARLNLENRIDQQQKLIHSINQNHNDIQNLIKSSGIQERIISNMKDNINLIEAALTNHENKINGILSFNQQIHHNHQDERGHN